MRTSYLIPAVLFGTFCLGSNNIKAQQNAGFAITGSTKGDVAWMTVRKIDLGSGAEIQKIYAPTDKPAILDALSGTRLGAVTAPTETFVAATAYDSKTN